MPKVTLLYGHSCDREVSEAYYLAPHLVRPEELEPGDIQEGNWRLLRPDQAVQWFYFYDEMTANGGIGISGGNGEQGTACGVAALEALQELLAPQGFDVLAEANIKR